MIDSDFELAIGNKVPGVPYRLVAELGEGGFGAVWKAQHEIFLDYCALKFCKVPDAAITLRNEAKHLHRIQNAGRFEGFVTLRDLHVDPDRQYPFVVYEFVEGEDLEKHLDRRRGAFTPFEASEIVFELATIMAQAHTLPDPIVHRDLKPSNILVVQAGPSWKFKIADFGIGVVAVGTTRAELLALSDDGRELSGLGTRCYMSYEQRNARHNGDPTDDVHALGVIWYELLAGESHLWPHGPPSHNRHYDWTSLRAELKKFGLDDDQSALLESCLKHHEHRPKHAGDLAREIRKRYPPLREEIQKDAAEVSRLRLAGEDWLAHLNTVASRRTGVWNSGVKAGIAEASWLVGLLWENGINTTDKSANLVTARAHFEGAAGRGLADAQYDLAIYRMFGIGGEKATAFSVPLLKSAAEQGHRDARYELGLRWSRFGTKALAEYLSPTNDDGPITAEDITISTRGEDGRPLLYTRNIRGDAYSLLNKAAACGHAEAQFQLGQLFAGDDKLENAIEYFRLAADAGHPEAQFRLGDWLARRQQDRFADPAALAWFRRAAVAGHAEAQLRAGEWLFRIWDDPDCESNEMLSEAVDWLRLAARRGHVRAQIELVNCCQQARSCLGEAEDHPILATLRQGLRWLRESAEKGNGDAQEFLAEKLLDGEFSEDELQEASLDPLAEGRKWLEASANQGRAHSQYRLAELLDGYDPANGEVVPAMRERQRAEEWYAKAALQGHIEAAQRLLSLRRGQAVPTNMGHE